MEINYQINQHECGLCVLKSLINHYYKKDIPIEELLTSSKLSAQGLSIYDFEMLGEKYGLVFDSYQLDFDEFINLDINNYFVLLLNFNNNYHYVIAKKHHQKVIIYCSQKGQYELTYEQLKSYWLSIYIEVNKNNKLDFSKIKSGLKSISINWKAILFINTIQIIILLLTIFNASFFDQLFSKVIANENLANLLFIVVLFSLTYISKQIGLMFINLFSYKATFKQYKYLQHKMIRKLNNKYLSFYNKVDENFIRNANDFAFEISSFNNIYLNNFIADFITIIGVSIYIATINFIFFILFIIYFIIVCVIEIVNYNYFKKQIVLSEDLNNHFHNLWNKLVFKINYLNNFEYKSSISFNLKNQHLKIRDLFFKNLNYSNCSGLVSFISQHLVFIILIILSCQYIINDQLFNFTKLTIIMNLFQLLSSSSKSIVTIAHKYNQYKWSMKIYDLIINVDNKPLTTGINEINKIKYIQFNQYQIINDCLISGPSGCGKTTMLSKLNNLIKLDDNDKILFNQFNSKHLANRFFNEQMIYLNNQVDPLNQQELINLIDKCVYKQVIIKLLNHMNIKDLNKCSLGQKQALGFIKLLMYTNKVICLDETLANVDHQLKEILLTDIKPLIVKNNFLIYVSHDENISQYFSQEINLYEQKN